MYVTIVGSKLPIVYTVFQPFAEETRTIAVVRAIVPKSF
jgi:hypothetical protein